MIKLFVLDIDGCISMPFEMPDWNSISKIRELNLRSKNDPQVPAVTICSGRPLPYVEAVGQWLGVYYPVVFESGGGMYDYGKNEVEWAAEITPELMKGIDRLRGWVRETIIPAYPGSMVEFTKETDVGVIHKEEPVIIEIFSEIKSKIARDFPELEAHRTEISVNAIVSAANKGRGLDRLSDKTGISLDEMAYIGDSSGDIPALKKVRHGFIPSNGTDQAADHGKRVKGKATAGILEAYEWLITANKKITDY